ncbi:APC family permease [Paracoccus sp. (in: a-proteobacteria)]|uniref:APC family permease n=1 Tax=Paracoccus sp. TaxID=267 RepID=UPI002897E3AD|nr:APC family permease [Paracoccus sp. (in: a-proteobacteria)]
MTDIPQPSAIPPAGEYGQVEGQSSQNEMMRSLSWQGAFWVAAGVPPLVLFSIGGIAGVAGKVAFVVWTVSMCMGFLQSFTYAEMAGMFGNKSGGTSVYGATAWMRYSKLVAPLSVWCNWFAWSPVLSLGCTIAAGYILNAFFPIPMANSPQVADWIAAHASSLTESSPRVLEWLAANPGQSAAQGIQALLSADAITALTPAIRTWEAAQFTIPALGTLHFNTTFVVGVALMLTMYTIQKRGIGTAAGVQKVLAIIVLVPLLAAGIIPILTGSINWSNVTNIVPPAAANSPVEGSWNVGGWTLILGALYITAWSTYGFETAVCYTRELKNPKTDTFKAIFYSGLLCMLFFILIPFAFQGVYGHEGLLAPAIADGSGIGEAMGRMISSSSIVIHLFVLLMILALMMSIMTAGAGSSRTLYQGSRDGWLPKYLSKVNENGAPVGAMRQDLVFNTFLLALASDPGGYFYVLAISNVGYLMFNFLNLNAGWIHRIDSPHLDRPWKAPNWLLGTNTVLAFVNAIFLGAGAKVWGYSQALWAGLIFAALIIPVFAYRHWVTDKGRFPREAMEDLGLDPDGDLGPRRAGILPYLALLAGLGVVLFSNWFFVSPS